MDCCARRDAGDRGSAAGSGHSGRAQDKAAAGLRAEASPTVGGSRLGCSGDQGCGGSAGTGHWSHRRAAMQGTGGSGLLRAQNTGHGCTALYGAHGRGTTLVVAVVQGLVELRARELRITVGGSGGNVNGNEVGAPLL